MFSIDYIYRCWSQIFVHETTAWSQAHMWWEMVRRWRSPNQQAYFLYMLDYASEPNADFGWSSCSVKFIGAGSHPSSSLSVLLGASRPWLVEPNTRTISDYRTRRNKFIWQGDQLLSMDSSHTGDAGVSVRLPEHMLGIRHSPCWYIQLLEP